MPRSPSQCEALQSAPLQLPQIPSVVNAAAAACASQGPALPRLRPAQLRGLFLLPITGLSWSPCTAQRRTGSKEQSQQPVPPGTRNSNIHFR